jgi:glycosyltransferase involved in cell wall biosynthesis
VPPESVASPFISVIIPTFNAARYLPDAIDSVRRQNYEPLEIILVDDGSTDDTRSVAARFPDVRYLYQQNQGAAGARNTGIAAAAADILAFLDVDDLWTPNHLRLLLPPLLAEPALRFVWGNARFVRIDQHAAGTRSHIVLRDNVPMFLIGSGLYRRATFHEVGLFDSAMRMGEDTDWFQASRQRQTPQKQVPELVLIYRKREGSLTCGKNTFAGLNTMAVLRNSIRRHRKNQSPVARGKSHEAVPEKA